MIISEDPDICWPWRNPKAHHKWYGKIKVCANGVQRYVFAHRVAFKLFHGNIDETLNVLHKCDNPPCCNPHHLFQGTHADNAADCIAKGRFQAAGNGMILHPESVTRNEKSGRCKHSNATIAEIRQRRSDGESLKSLSAHFGIDKAYIWQICSLKRRPLEDGP